MPSTRTTAGAVGALAALALLLGGAATAVAQQPFSDPRSSIDLTTRIGLQFGVRLVVNLFLGGALVVAGPEYAADKVDEFRSEPGESVGWGLVVGIGVPIVLLVLAVTLIGLIVAIPGMIVLAAVGILGSAVVVVLVGSAVTKAERPGGTEVLLGALVLSLLTAIPIVGGFVNWVVGLPGIGLVGRDLYRSWAEG
ncbi:hypothetical protein [Halobaculum lipolyticum]|uniref:DUF8173 domain-containing protein n=1 Tax=Halobaculum lipolyticum TaxID=3032001 RepID=A0ABD5WAJ0_9EURY|nr:hypothetical protein [Halobaculum sp. DT31]